MLDKEQLRFLVDTHLHRVILNNRQGELQSIAKTMMQAMLEVIANERGRVKRANARHKTKTRWSKSEKICVECLIKIVEKYSERESV
jgi:hypothetical protein